MILLFLLLMIDFVLTYFGVSQGIINEGNPLLVWVFQLPFWQSLGVRLVWVAIILTPFYFLDKMNRRVCRKTLIAAYVINLIVIGFHLHWIIDYFAIV